ncbi:hypothetical protein Q9L58_008514 [Maublancomyces gigas]|uniref:Uncharacterized protein n=1 Tax=Discina gigas TaxID=1032678 RepID=A0ABR3G9P2_9PEZI
MATCTNTYPVGIFDQDLRNAGMHAVNRLNIVLQETLGRLEHLTAGVQATQVDTVKNLDQMTLRLEVAVADAAGVVRVAASTLDSALQRSTDLLDQTAVIVVKTVAVVIMLQFTWFMFKVLYSDYGARKSMCKSLVLGLVGVGVACGLTKVMFS